MKFEHPEILFFLILVPIITFFEFYFENKKAKSIRKYFTKENLKKVSIKRKKSKVNLKIFLLTMVFILIIFALAGPQYGYKEVILSQKETNIFIAVDVSLSMRANDVSPSRIELAKRKIIDFINLLRGERVSLIAFAGVSFISIPLTNDYSIFKEYINIIDTDLIPVQGTNFYKLIEKVIEIVKRDNINSANLLIISDGEDFGGNIEKAIKLCKKYNIKIYSLGIGTTNPVPIKLENGALKKDKNDNIVMTKLDEEFLKKISLKTDGVYIRAIYSDKDIKIMYKKMKNNSFKNVSRKKKIYINRFQWFVLPAFILMCLYFIIDERKFSYMVIFILSVTYLNASNPSILNNKGIKFYNKGKYNEALKLFDKAYRIDNNSKFLYNKALSLYKLKDFQKSKEIFSKILENSSLLREKSYFNRGVINYKLKKYKKALEDFKNALKINPNDIQARINYELTLKKLKNLSSHNKNKHNDKKKKNKKKQNKQPKKNNQKITKKQKLRKKEMTQIKKLLNLYNENPNFLKKSIKKKLHLKNIPVDKDW